MRFDMKHHSIVLSVALAAGLVPLSCKTARSSEGPVQAASALAATPSVAPPAAVHGMVLFGNDTIYASHIPMYHVPHDWQVLFEVTLSHPMVDAKALYQKQLVRGVQPLITIEPRPFVLPQLINGDIHSFVASLYRGNFEDHGEVLLQGMTVTVKAVLFKQHLSLDLTALPQPTYFLIPTSMTTAVLVHRISAPDNFDQILQVKTGAAPLPTTPIGRLITVIFPGVADASAARLRAGDALELTRNADGWSATVGPGNSLSPMALYVVSDFYCTLGREFSRSFDAGKS